MSRKALTASLKKKLRDPAWQFVGVNNAVIFTLSIFVFIRRVNRPRKKPPSGHALPNNGGVNPVAARNDFSLS